MHGCVQSCADEEVHKLRRANSSAPCMQEFLGKRADRRTDQEIAAGFPFRCLFIRRGASRSSPDIPARSRRDRSIARRRRPRRVELQERLGSCRDGVATGSKPINVVGRVMSDSRRRCETKIADKRFIAKLANRTKKDRLRLNGSFSSLDRSVPRT